MSNFRGIMDTEMHKVPTWQRAVEVAFGSAMFLLEAESGEKHGRMSAGCEAL